VHFMTVGGHGYLAAKATMLHDPIRDPAARL
jgi:hypothetical protein